MRKKTPQMNVPFQKLHSRRGATLIIALVFFLLCSFVGSTVLAAATANSGRLGAQQSAKQIYLSQRSAALLMQSGLMLSEGAKNALTVTNETTTTTVITTLSGGGTTQTSTTSYRLAFAAPSNVQALHRVLYEAAVRSYLAKNTISESSPMDFTNFEFGGTQASLSDFCPAAGSCSVQLNEGGAMTDEVLANYTCASGASPYAFTFSFSDSATGVSQISLFLKATVTPGEMRTVTDSSVLGNTRTEVKKDTQTTVITWGDPVIRKGGAA